MQLVYLDGDDAESSRDTIRNVTADLWRLGYAVISQPLNTNFVGLFERPSLALLGKLTMLKQCHLMYVMPGWGQDYTRRILVTLARREGVPIYYYPELPPEFDCDWDYVLGINLIGERRGQNNKIV